MASERGTGILVFRYLRDCAWCKTGLFTTMMGTLPLNIALAGG
jgi:hypothetical protein